MSRKDGIKHYKKEEWNVICLFKFKIYGAIMRVSVQSREWVLRVASDSSEDQGLRASKDLMPNNHFPNNEKDILLHTTRVNA